MITDYADNFAKRTHFSPLNWRGETFPEILTYSDQRGVLWNVSSFLRGVGGATEGEAASPNWISMISRMRIAGCVTVQTSPVYLRIRPSHPRKRILWSWSPTKKQFRRQGWLQVVAPSTLSYADNAIRRWALWDGCRWSRIPAEDIESRMSSIPSAVFTRRHEFGWNLRLASELQKHYTRVGTSYRFQFLE